MYKFFTTRGCSSDLFCIVTPIGAYLIDKLLHMRCEYHTKTLPKSAIWIPGNSMLAIQAEVSHRLSIDPRGLGKGS